MNTAEAKEKLWKAHLAVEQGKMIDAMKAVGMEWEWMEDMSMTEAVEVFQVRVFDLQQLINGEAE